MVTVIAMS